MTPTVAVILSTHNRIDMTRAALGSLLRSARNVGWQLLFFAVDDGSSDGTASMLTEEYQARVSRGDGTLFWASAMAMAERMALQNEAWSHILWINDDIVLDPGALRVCSDVLEKRPGSIVVGALRGEDGATTYGGFAKSGPHPLSFEPVEPSSDPTEIAAFNGNFVLMSRATRDIVGPIDGSYPHALADIDYGVRAAARGVPLLLAPGTLGVCVANSAPPGAVLADWRKFVGTKGGGNPRAMSRFILRHRPPYELVWIPVTYMLWWARRMRAR